MSNLAKRNPVAAEHARLEDSSTDTAGNWKAIGPYVSESAWGTVREDSSADGQAWQYFPYEHARSRAYGWKEDGLAGLCDRAQRLCFALAFWNGGDPFLKERIFGLSGPEGNHGEGRQRVLVVHRRNTDQLVASLALPLSPRGVSLRVA